MKMPAAFTRIQTVVGIDKAIAYRVSGIAVSSLGGVITLILIALKFSADEQGVYYTFSSIVALQVFFELGLGGIIVQYVAHEFAHLRWDRGILSGPERHRSRLASLFRLLVKWYVVTAVLMWCILLAAGFLFFGLYNRNPAIAWQLPWIVLCCGTALFFLVNMFLAFVEGFGFVKEMSKIRTIAQCLGLLATAVCLYAGYGLYALGVTALTRVAVSAWCFRSMEHHILLRNLWQVTVVEKLAYFKEIFPFQWKIALSWVSGYFIFQLFNPVLFAYTGARAAGQMGLTMALLGIVSGLSTCWVTTKIPLLSTLIAKRAYRELDQKFNKTLLQESAIALCFIVMLLLFLQIVAWGKWELNGMLLRERFLPPLPMLCMAVAIFANIFVTSFAVYLRCHKQEPYLALSIATGALCCLSTIFMTKYFGINGMTLGYLIITLWGNLWGYLIFRRKQKEWHSTAESKND